MKKKGGLFLSLGVSGVAIFWLVRIVDWQEVVQSMQQVSYLCLLSVSLIYLLGFLPRGLRWQLMLSTVKEVSLTSTTQVVIMGYAANNILPFRLGEVVRAYIMGHKNNISRMTCLGSIAAERVIDGMVIVSLLGATMIFLTAAVQQVEALRKLFLTGGVIFLFSVLFMIMVLIHSGKILEIWKRLFGQTGLAVLENLIHSLNFLRSRRLVFPILLLSIFVWLLEGAMFVLILWDMGLKNPVAAGYFCLGIVNLGILLPSAPGYIGVYEAAAVFAFLTLGYSESMGITYGLLIHLVQFLPLTIIGVFIFVRSRYRFGEFYKTISGETSNSKKR